MDKVKYNPNLTFGSLPTTCFRSERPAFFHTGSMPTENDNRIEKFMRSMTATVRNDRFTIVYNGKPVLVHPKWIRDHVHELKAFKHWEHDLKSYIELMCDVQRDDGQFYEMVQLPGNGHWFCVNDSNRILDERNNLIFVRVGVEADIEYLMVEGAYQVFQATGDIEWLERIMPKLEKGINYIQTSSDRWDEEHGLAKRPFTVDTWDFVYDVSTDEPRDDRNIYPEKTPMSIMHGDNSGLFQAMNQLAYMNEQTGKPEKSDYWKQRAEAIKNNLNKYCWNGNFYTHQLHLNHNGDGTDETARISLSNAYDMNRSVTTFEQANKIIESFRRIYKESGYFAEWFSVYPPYEKFRGSIKKNVYINGCIASLTAGELAKAAFNNGCEEYGWNIFTRLMDMYERDNQLFFLYNPVTAENAGGGPSGWGAAALISAFEEGVAGIVDTGIKFSSMRFQPRWTLTNQKFGKYITGYEISNTFVETSFQMSDSELLYHLACPSDNVECHILMPKGKKPVKVVCNDREIDFTSSRLNESVYADFSVTSMYAEKGTQKIYDFEICYSI